MRILIKGGLLEIWSGDRLAGVYRADDSHKPHLAKLRSPAGYDLIVSRPHDHPHHKGAQFGLRTTDLNFWEERALPANPTPTGVQTPKTLNLLSTWGATASFEQTLLWTAEDGSLPTFAERRVISCEDTGAGFRWRWHTALEPLRDVELAMSVWSMARPDGRKVNYDGFGFRMRRDFSGTGGNQLVLDGRDTSFADALGTTPAKLEFTGSIDETLPVRRISLTLEQTRGGALFTVENPFAWVSVGPSNAAPVRWARGQVWEETYTFTVADAPSV